jgi:hypothetical protein
MVFGAMLAMTISAATAHVGYQTDNIVKIFEARFGMSRGETRTDPVSGHTFRYDGTAIRGHHYDIGFDVLD